MHHSTCNAAPYFTYILWQNPMRCISHFFKSNSTTLTHFYAFFFTSPHPHCVYTKVSKYVCTKFYPSCWLVRVKADSWLVIWVFVHNFFYIIVYLQTSSFTQEWMQGKHLECSLNLHAHHTTRTEAVFQYLFTLFHS